MPPENAIELTSPLTLGAQEVSWNGAVALKLKAFVLVTVAVAVPFHPLIKVKVPTANMVLPHCTSWRIWSVAPSATSVGVRATGAGDTGPVWASAGVPDAADSSRQQALAAPAISKPRTPNLPRRGPSSR